MAVAVTSRTAFSLLVPPLIGEFGWDRGLVAGAFSFGFLVSAVMSPVVGRVMDRRGPRLVIETGVVLVATGLLLAPSIVAAWQFYVTLGVLVGAGAKAAERHGRGGDGDDDGFTHLDGLQREIVGGTLPPKRLTAAYQRKAHRPAKAPIAVVNAMPSVYQTATKGAENSGQWKA